MRKIIIVLLLLTVIFSPVFARNYTEEEFREVYNALQETTELLKNKQAELDALNIEVDKLMNTNEQLLEKLTTAISLLNESNTLLQETRSRLDSSNSVINKLNSQSWLLGGHVGCKGLLDNIKTGWGIDIGHKLWLGYVTGSFSLYNDKSLSVSAGYSFVF